MNKQLEQFKQSVNGKSVAVIGIGISNKPLIKYLTDLGARVTACDRRTAEELGADYQLMLDWGISLQLGDCYLDNLTQEMIFKTPGLRYDMPQLIQAQEAGSVVTSEMELFFSVCPAHILAVTGSDGKTTTTTLIHEMLKRQGYRTWLGGNIGTPLLTQTDAMREEDWVVLELSSFQLHTMKKSPEIAVITNISPNHLDMHKDYQEYIDAKKNIMLYQSKTDKLVLNADNSVTSKIGENANANVYFFSGKRHTNGAYLKDGMIYYMDRPVLSVMDIQIPGMHNVENYMASISAVGHLVDPDVIVQVAKEFSGVEHRIELVRTIRGVRYYNSSIDSSPNRTKNTLSVFPQKVILIAGGKDKGIPYDELGPVLTEHVKVLILIGATADKIQKSLEDEIKRTGKGKDIEVIHVSTYDQAVNTAEKQARAGDIVVLSPASTSFDMFKNFEERGNLFKTLVNQIKE